MKKKSISGNAHKKPVPSSQPKYTIHDFPQKVLFLWIHFQINIKSISVSCSVMSDSLRPHVLYPPDSSVHRISQARILEWVAIPSSRGTSQPREVALNLHLLYCKQILYHLSHHGIEAPKMFNSYKISLRKYLRPNLIAFLRSKAWAWILALPRD